MKPLALSLTFLSLVASGRAQSIVEGQAYTDAGISHLGSMSLDDDSGKLQITHYDFSTNLSRPITSAADWVITPNFSYRASQLDFSGTSAAFPMKDEFLHSLSLSSSFIRARRDTPWIFAGWLRGEMASDFQDVDTDDFTADIAAGVGYRFNERLTLGLGVAVLNLNGDTRYIPRPSIDWVISDTVRVGTYGPNFAIAWTPLEEWIFSVRAGSFFGSWNIEGQGGESRNIDIQSLRAGIYVDRHLFDKVWLSVGTGITFANEIEYQRPSGSKVYDSDLDEGWYGQIGVRVETW